jgi:hypothetical protein
MKKYIYAILISLLTTVVFRLIFNNFDFDADFMIGWLGAMAYFNS